MEASRPWNGVTVGDAGPYSDGSWQEIWRNIIGWGGERANSGVFLGTGTPPNDGLRVVAQSPVTTAVDVQRGAAMVRGIFYLNDDTESFGIAANSSGDPRIDTIILRADYALQTVRLALKQGTPAVTPAPPGLTQTAGVMWEIPVADIAAADSFTSITDANITARHEWVNAPPGVYLDGVLNNSGVELNTGDVVVWDNSAVRAVTRTTTQDDRNTAGVWVGRTANGGYGRVLHVGIGYVRATTAVTNGSALVSSSTAGSAVISVTARPLARALETTSAAGLVLCMVRSLTGSKRATIVDQKAQNTQGGDTVNGAWTTRVLNTELFDPFNIVTISGNQFTPVAGRYRVFVSMPFRSGANAGVARGRLRNVTAASALKLSQNVPISVNGEGAIIILEHEFVANGTDAYDVQYFMNVGARVTDGGGNAINETGAPEIYTVVELEQL